MKYCVRVRREDIFFVHVRLICWKDVHITMLSLNENSTFINDHKIMDITMFPLRRTFILIIFIFLVSWPVHDSLFGYMTNISKIDWWPTFFLFSFHVRPNEIKSKDWGSNKVNRCYSLNAVLSYDSLCTSWAKVLFCILILINIYECNEDRMQDTWQFEVKRKLSISI